MVDNVRSLFKLQIQIIIKIIIIYIEYIKI